MGCRNPQSQRTQGEIRMNCPKEACKGKLVSEELKEYKKRIKELKLNKVFMHPMTIYPIKQDIVVDYYTLLHCLICKNYHLTITYK